VRIFDGSDGWKMLPDGKGPPRLQEYTADEVSSRATARASKARSWTLQPGVLR